MPQSFGESFVEGGVSNIKGLTDAVFNLPNVDISAIRERAYKLSSDVIKYTTDSQYRDSVNQEVMYDFKKDIAYGQILALQGDADKIGQVVGEASGKLAIDLALSAATAGAGKFAGQAIKTINKVDGNVITPNTPNNSNDIIDANVRVGDWDLGNVYNYATPLKLEEKKFDYFFGMVDSNKHNLDRSLQNQNQLNSIGIFNNEYGKEILKDSIYKQLQNPNNIIDRRISNYNGKSQVFETREMLIVGPNGVKMMVVDFEVMNNYSRRVATIIIKGGK